MLQELQEEIAQRHTPDAIEEEIRIFEERAGQYIRGEISDEQFRPFRLKHGTYGQRQAGVQMLRVKIPSGVLNPEQLRTLADIADTYSTARGHLTTRQNVQFHFVKLENVPAAMRLLAQAGLTTREACGNTVRNVTSCPLSGICPGESFDVTPYALGVTRFLLRHPDFHNLPRKFKIAFSGCEDDGNCAVAGIHDVGLIARVHGSNGTGKRGFKVLVGGGLGSLPTEAAVLTEFLPVEELLPTVEAILRVFDASGNRKNKFKARMKFVLRDKGIDEFRRLVCEKRKQITTPPEVLTVPSPLSQPLVNISLGNGSETAFSPDYEKWAEHNLMSQKQPGYKTAWIKLSAGTILSSQLRGLADLLEKHKLAAIRIAILQNFVLPWIPAEKARQVFDDLQALDLTAPGARTIADVTGCPGATTCNLGITRSLTLADELARELAEESDPEIQKLRIKISGCPNSCGQHHIADIGFYGNARKIGDQQAPFYQLLLGGEVSERGVRFGKQMMPVPAKQVPQIVRELLHFYKRTRGVDETFRHWAERVPQQQIAERLQPYVDAAEESPETFVDWGDMETYSLKLGRGECAA
ncbi:MAG TPA: nitrite/sulfite reductase [Terriglobales bacterium]